MKLIYLLAVLVAVAHARSLQGEESVEGALLTSKCEGPCYKVLNKTREFEIREYENATWAISFGRSRWLTDFAVVQAGIGLARYLSGDNANHTKIPASKPIVSTIVPPHPPPPPHKNGSHPVDDECESVTPSPDDHHHHHHHHHHHPHPPPPRGPPAVVVAGYIPKKFKGEPPKPNCSHIKIVNTNSTKVYVHKFGGWAVSWFIRHEIGHLAKALREEGICARRGRFFVASYDGPWKFFGRKNEIWWAKGPKHHHNHTEIPQQFETSTMPFEAIDPVLLFPEEFPEAEQFDFPEEDENDMISDDQNEMPSEGLKELDYNKAVEWWVQQGKATT